MRTVTLFLLGGMAFSSIACRPKLSTPSSPSETAAAVPRLQQRLLGKWELVEAPGQRLPWLNRREDFGKARTLEFLEGNKLLYRGSGGAAQTTTFRVLNEDTVDINLLGLLGRTPPVVPITEMKVKATITNDELTLTDPAQRFDRYRRLK